MDNLLKYICYFIVLVFISCGSDDKSIPTNKKIEDTSLKKSSLHIQFASIYPGGTKIYTAINGDIHVSIIDENGDWSRPLKVKGAINSEFNESNPAISPDGGYMYFTSNRKEGFGGKDIYLAQLDSHDVCTSVVNLGPAINTKLDEDMPYMSKDGERFYFISKGHESIGGYDIFMSTIKNVGFSISEPMDGINTQSDDLLYLYFLSEGYAQKSDSSKAFENLVIVNSGFSNLNNLAQEKEIILEEKDIINEYLKGDASFEKLLLVFGDTRIEDVHYELQIGASKGDLVLSNELQGVGKLVVRDVSNGVKRYSLGIYETLNEIEKVKPIAAQEGFSDAFLVCYRSGKKVLISEILKQY